MREACSLVWSVLVLLFRSRVSLEAEILILRHQLNIQRRHLPKRLAFSAMDRLIFVGLYRLVPNTIKALTIVKPDTVDPLASCRFQIVLALEIAAPLRPTNCAVGNSPADPRDEHRQPVVGSAENPWRASQARHRDRPDQRRQVYGAEEGPSLAGMEDVPSQPCGRHCRDGPLRRADNLVPAADFGITAYRVSAILRCPDVSATYRSGLKHIPRQHP